MPGGDGGADPGAAVRVELLGPLRLQVDGAPVKVPGPKRRAVLALLAMAEGRPVASDRLLDAVWPADPPKSARAALHSHISRLRRHLGPAATRLEAPSGNYRLTLADGGLDAAQARSLLAQARTIAGRDPAAAGALLRQARALWRGPVLADLADIEPIAAWSVGVEELRRQVGDLLVRCAVDAGEADGAVGLAAEQVAADPLREPAVLLLMRALAATGRAAEALRAGYQHRRRLAEEAGLDPSGALGELERQIASGTAAPTGRRAPTIPRPATRLVGRDAEVAALHRLLDHERLVTVVGPGGVGKTRLALEAARRAETATVLPLAPLTDPAAIAHALAAALDLQVVRGDVLSGCVALLAAGPRLLVVDNCEHLLDAVRDAVSTLLDACPGLTVLATGREPLRLPGERPFRLAPLALPDPRDPGDLGRAPAVAVFVDRARRVRPGFPASPEEVRGVGEIVRRLDGMPLAIELAAGRLSSLGLADLHARLDRALDLLGDGRTTGDARHRTLRATIQWSYQLLPDDERRLFRHLSVFPDGFDLATAEQIAADLVVAGDPAGALVHLVDASMVDAELGDRPRYRMLETLRSFGLDRLLAADEDAAASERLLRWAVDLAAWIGVTATTDSEPEADARLRGELPTLRAAWRLARQQDRLDDAVALVLALGDAAGWRDLTEVWGWAQELVADPATQAHHRAAAVLGVAASAAWLRGDPAEAGRLARRGLKLATDEEGRWWGLTSLALADLSGGAYTDAQAHASQAAALAPRPDQNHGIAALAAAYGGSLEAAGMLNQRLAAVAASPTLLGFHHYVAGEIHSAAGRRDQAEERYLRAIELARSSGATFGDGIAAVGLVTVRADAGRIDQALRGYRDLIGYWERTGSWIQQWTTLRNLARLLHTLGDHQPALFLEAAADHAPDAAAVSDTAPNQQRPPGAQHLAADRLAQIRSEASSAARARVLEVARQSIDHHLER